MRSLRQTLETVVRKGTAKMFHSQALQIAARKQVNAKKHLKKIARSAFDEQVRTGAERRCITHYHFKDRKWFAMPHGDAAQNHSGFGAGAFGKTQNL